MKRQDLPQQRVLPDLLLLIKTALVPVCPKLDAGEPGRSPSHLLTDCLQRDVRTAFNDEFIVDVADDLTETEGFHGAGQDIIGTGSVLRTAIIFFYLSNEGVSLLENAAYLGLPIPQKFKEVLEQLHNRAEKEGQ